MPDQPLGLDPADFGTTGLTLGLVVGIAMNEPERVLDRGRQYGRGGGAETMQSWKLRAVQELLRRHGVNLDTPDALRWLSCQPLTNELDDPLDLTDWLASPAELESAIDWVVLSGESEPAAGLRPINLPNLIRLTEQAVVAGVCVFVKLGEPWAREVGAASPAGRDMSEWPSPLRVEPGNPRALAALTDAGRMPSIPDLDSPPAIPAARYPKEPRS